MTVVHHITGRLRLKFPQLKNQIQLCRAVDKAIRALPSVRLVQVNAVTGSLLIHYDARGAQQSALLETIQDLLAARFSLSFVARAVVEPRGTGLSHSNPLADRVAEMVIEKIVERSALALFGILI